MLYEDVIKEYHLLNQMKHVTNFVSYTGGSVPGGTASAQPNPGILGMGGGATVLPAFEYRGTWIPILSVSAQGSAKAT